MIIDKNDLAILRHLERNGYCLESLATNYDLELSEIQRRLQNLENNQVISNYHATLFIPPFLSGTWTWGCVLANTQNRSETIEKIQQKITFITEIWLNSNLPSELGHNFSLLFYSKDFDQELQFIQDIPDLTNLQAYRINDYTYPIPRVFSQEERQLLRAIYQNPTANLQQLSEICKKNFEWVKNKAQRLFWTPQNPDGIIYILPEIQYSQIENFIHCHFIIESKTNLSLLIEELNISGFHIIANQYQLQNISTQNRRLLQVETDLWGFNDFLIKKAHLDSFTDLKIKGLIFAEKILIPTHWQNKLLEY